MADTRQVVLWTLGKRCPLRQQDDWENPLTAIKALGAYRTYSRLRERKGGFGIFDDVCVTGVTASVKSEANTFYDYPADGFIVSKQISQIGGLPSLLRLCGECPANTDKDGLAGCNGHLSQEFYSKEGDQQLERLINQLGIGPNLDSIFPSTRRHWFRFWIHSPIPPAAIPLLRQLFGAVFEEGLQVLKNFGRQDLGKFEDLKTFLDALDLSVAGNISLHVRLTPPGHTDFGWYTVFAHCPRCKWEAPVERWKRKYPDTEIECTMCGAKYSPARTHSSERDDYDAYDLRKLLDPAKFEKVAFQSLVEQGASEAEASRLVQLQEEKHRQRMAETEQKRKLFQQHQQFLEQVLYHGLKNLNSGDKKEPAWALCAGEMEEVIRRVQHHGGKIFMISHASESGDHDELLQVKWPTSANATLQALRKLGCNEKFSAHLKIPDEVVEQWRNSIGQPQNPG
jgi:hypothetical protein